MASYEDMIPDILQEIYSVPDGVALNAINRATINFCNASFCYNKILDVLPWYDTSKQASEQGVLVTTPANTKIIELLSARAIESGQQLGTVTREQLDIIGYHWPAATSELSYTYIIRDTTVANTVIPVPLIKEYASGNGTAITGITNAAPPVVTAAGHGLATGDAVSLHDTDTTPLEGEGHYVTVLSASTFSLDGALAGGVGTTGYMIQHTPIKARFVLAPTRSDTDIDDNIYDEYFEGFIRGALGILHAMPGKDWTDMALAAAYGTEVAETAAAIKAEVLARNSAYARVGAANVG